MSLTDAMTWNDIEKYMTANPKSVLAFYIFNRAAFLDNEPIADCLDWGKIDHKKFKQISSDIFGLVKFMIREDGVSNQDNIPMPGFELDKLIAEKVLGWKPSTWPGLWIDDMCRQNRLSNFSTDIKAAWEFGRKIQIVRDSLGRAMDCLPTQRKI